MNENEVVPGANTVPEVSVGQPMGGGVPPPVSPVVGGVPPAGGMDDKKAAEEAAKQIIGEEGKKGNWWTWILAVLLVLILIGVGYWLVKANGLLSGLGTVLSPRITPTASVTPTKASGGLESQSSSDEVVTIKADLEASDYSNLTPELDQMERELTQ